MLSSRSEPTPLVGRRAELAEVRRRMRHSRLVVLVGPGGVGKTTLARGVLDLHRRGPRSGWLVPLDAVVDAGLVPGAVAEGVGIRPQPQDLLTAGLAAWLGDREALLVLDSCEHLLPACRALVEALLEGCPGLQVVATSRQPLGARGEDVVHVEPFPTPQASREQSPEELASYEAVRLFVQRAAAAAPGFVLSQANAVDVALLVRLLEGVPLSLELAAARMRTLNPRALVARLQGRYDALGRGPVDGPSRQQSVAANVAWSYELCSPAERRLWQRLSVFRGSFDAEAAQAVCVDRWVGPLEVPLLLESLATKSVLVTESRGAVGAAESRGTPSYRMLDTIRHFGEQRLAESARVERWQERHAQWVEELVGRLADGWVGPDQAALIEGVRRHTRSVQAALEFLSGDPRRAPRAMTLVVRLGMFWWVAGRTAEGRQWLERALAHGTGSPAARATALSRCAYFAALARDDDRAEQALAEAAELLASLPRPDEEPASAADPAGDPTDLHCAWGHHHLAHGMFAVLTDRPAEATAPLEHAIGHLSAAGEEGQSLHARTLLAIASARTGDVDRGRALASEVVEVTESRGEQQMRGIALWLLGVLALLTDDLDDGLSLERRSLAANHAVGDLLGTALALEAIAAIAAASGELDRAALLLASVDRLADEIGLSPFSDPVIAEQRRRTEGLVGQGGEASTRAARATARRMSVEDALEVALGAPVVSPAPGSPRRVGSRIPLTRREEQVAALVVEGLTDQQIARRLAISVRTAQTHVQNILRKLGVTSRTQVSSWVGAANPT